VSPGAGSGTSSRSTGGSPKPGKMNALIARS
jgi:hypothetical protein